MFNTLLAWIAFHLFFNSGTTTLKSITIANNTGKLVYFIVIVMMGSISVEMMNILA